MSPRRAPRNHPRASTPAPEGSLEPSSFPDRLPGLSREPCQVTNIQIVCLRRATTVNLREERDARARLGRLKSRSEEFLQRERGIPPVVNRGEDGERTIPHRARSIPQRERGAAICLHNLRRRECAVPDCRDGLAPGERLVPCGPGDPERGEPLDEEGERFAARRSRGSSGPSPLISHGEPDAIRSG